jgi:hypothetical protein
MNRETKMMNRMTKRLGLLFAVALLALAAVDAGSTAAAPLTPEFECPEENFGHADQFGICNFDGQLDADATGAAVFAQAGGHPYDVLTAVSFNTHEKVISLPGFGLPEDKYHTAWPNETTKDVSVDLPPGLIGNPTAASTCGLEQLAFKFTSVIKGPLCPPASQIGTITIFSDAGEELFGGPYHAVPPLPVYNMTPPPGVPARFAFNVVPTNVVVTLDAKLRANGDYGFTINAKDSPQAVAFLGFRIAFWGTPAAESHKSERSCAGEISPAEEGATCSAGVAPEPFLRLPTSCPAPGEGLLWNAHIASWTHPATFDADGIADTSDPNWKNATYTSHNPPGLPDDPELFPGRFQDEGWGAPQGPEGCADVPVKGQVSAQPTTQNAETPTGINVTVSIPNPGLENPSGIASSDIKKTVVTLPEGVTLNPSQGEGLGVCTPSQYQQESLHQAPGEGCPSTSKIGTVDVHTPLLDETLEGAVYVAKPFDNPFNSLVALYIVIKNPERGVMIKLPGQVVPDPKSGQLVTTFDDLPQVPFSSFELHFREGVRSPLSTPRTCGDYTTQAVFTPWSDPAHTISSQSTFQITHGVGGTPCPSGNSAPFHPQLQAGSTNNNALSYSPFTLRMTRVDGEQEITNFSADLPPGLAAKLAGIPKCSDAQLKATAAAPGTATINGSICPAASQVGRVTVGFGVGSVLTYATGKVFLAGPYHGTPVSIATVAPAVVGPFDLGTVVQRSAFRVDPETAQVHVDSRASDPIPHILKGFELHLRDIRVYMDRPNFTFNPTNCNPLSVGAFLSGSGADFFNAADDPIVDVSNRFQASNCSLLPFKPKLTFKLRGGTHRSDHPALTATLRASPGDANIARAVVALPHSEFLDQSHIGTVCTRVQFAADACPPASVYGAATATTPLLDEALSGPVYLRSSSNPLPDLVIKLGGEIAVNLVGRIDSKNGGIRTTFATVPDTPVTKFALHMRGGKKGLFVNSRNLCKSVNRADVRFSGQNGKAHHLRPRMQSSCKAKARQGQGH